MTSVDAIVMEHYVKETEGLEKLNFTKECVVIVVIAVHGKRMWLITTRMVK